MLGLRTDMSFPKGFIPPSRIYSGHVTPYATLKLTASNNLAWSAFDLLIDSELHSPSILLDTTPFNLLV